MPSGRSLEPKIPRHDPAGRSRRREPAAYLGIIWDHTLCAVMNDLRDYECLARPHSRHTHDDQGKRVTAIYWGSSGRRVKTVERRW